MPIKIENVDLYSVSEVSQMLNVTTVSIRNYIKQGYLKGQKVMGRWVVLEEELSNFLRNSNAI
jgi:predicted site-specific integrase-resolvase